MENTAREFYVHMIHHEPEHWEALGPLIGQLKDKETKVIIIRNYKVLKSVMFCDSNYAMNKETRKSVSGLVATLGVTLLTRSSKPQRTIKLISTEFKCISLLELAQEVKFVNMLPEKYLMPRNRKSSTKIIKEIVS